VTREPRLTHYSKLSELVCAHVGTNKKENQQPSHTTISLNFDKAVELVKESELGGAVGPMHRRQNKNTEKSDMKGGPELEKKLMLQF
jgi:hypothetical protein